MINDVEMPGAFNGYDLAWQAHTRHPAAPVFVVSGSNPERRKLPPRARFFDKPIDPWVLVAQLHAALVTSKRARSRNAA